MKNILITIINRIIKLFYPSFKCPNDLVIATFKSIFAQKIIGINRAVHWPVHFTSKIISPKTIDIGTRAPGLSISCYLDGRNGIELGENVWIGPKVSIISKNHSISNFKDYLNDSPVIIGKNSWIAASAVILPGVKLGEHTIVAAGSIVTKSFDEKNILIGGVPAKKLKDIPPYQA